MFSPLLCESQKCVVVNVPILQRLNTYFPLNNTYDPLSSLELVLLGSYVATFRLSKLPAWAGHASTLPTTTPRPRTRPPEAPSFVYSLRPVKVDCNNSALVSPPCCISLRMLLTKTLSSWCHIISARRRRSLVVLGVAAAATCNQQPTTSSSSKFMARISPARTGTPHP